MQQLWLFWAAPPVGAVLGGRVYRGVFEISPEPDIAGRVTPAAARR